MKRPYLLLFILLFTGLTAFSQGSIIMKIDGVTAAEGEKIIAYEDNLTYPISFSSGGATGKSTFDNIKIKKPQSLSSYLIRYAATAAHINSGEFDFLDAGNNLIYKINLTDILVTKFANLAPECPSCQSLTQEIWLTFKTIQYTDPINGKVFGWNVVTNSPL